jgi:hypothetical protein
VPAAAVGTRLLGDAYNTGVMLGRRPGGIGGPAVVAILGRLSAAGPGTAAGLVLLWWTAPYGPAIALGAGIAACLLVAAPGEWRRFACS